MISAEIVIDKRYKTKKGYPVKISVYDSVLSKNKKAKYREYINLNVYQDNEALKLSNDLKRRQLELSDQVKFCNDNFMSLNEAVEIIKNGIPENDIDIDIKVLEKKLELLKNKRGLVNETGLIQFGTELINERKILKKPVLAHENALKAVKKFVFPNEDVHLNNITREWINQFDLFFIDRGLTDNTVYTYISMIRAIFKEAQLRESLNIKKENPFLKLRVFKKDKKNTELAIEDLIKITEINQNEIKTKSYLGQFGTKRLADMLLFQFCIGGHDLADVASLKWTNLINDRIVFKRYKNRYKKTSGEEVDNFLNQYCLDVIEKYGDKNSEYIFSFLGKPDTQEYKRQIMQFNRYGYKIIANHIGSENSFTSKSTRYLFRTTAGNLLIDSLMLMKIQGHTPQGITFGYQGTIHHEVQDKEHKKILDLVFKPSGQ